MQTAETLTRIPFVDLNAQYKSIKSEIDDAIATVISQTAFIGGPHVKEFEEAFARYCGTGYCVGVANGTDALFIALKTLGIGPGDEVITAANTFVATSEAIKMAGAQVVFCDCDATTYNIDVTQIEAKITPRTKAIIPVHLYGQPADMDPIVAIARKHNLRIVGDAAQAHGATYKGRPIATLADITCYSFYPGKNLGAYGDAGALVTDNQEWATAARMIANHGRTKKYDHDLEGVNSRLDGLQGAILNVKLRHIEHWTESRRQNAARYNEALKGAGVVTPLELDGVSDKRAAQLRNASPGTRLPRRTSTNVPTDALAANPHSVRSNVWRRIPKKSTSWVRQQMKSRSPGRGGSSTKDTSDSTSKWRSSATCNSKVGMFARDAGWPCVSRYRVSANKS